MRVYYKIYLSFVLWRIDVIGRKMSNVRMFEEVPNLSVIRDRSRYLEGRLKYLLSKQSLLEKKLGV